jgi:hypothetical protein
MIWVIEQAADRAGRFESFFGDSAAVGAELFAQVFARVLDGVARVGGAP